MQLYILSHGKSKKRQHPIMIDEKRKVENYMTARERSGVVGWHTVQPAPKSAVPWKQRTASVGKGNNCLPPLVGRGRSGYISKHGFIENT